MSDELIFYTRPMSRGRTIRWLLEELDVPHRAVLVDHATASTNDAYRAVNPLLKVPAIVHGGRTVTETPAICVYLAEAYPEAGLAPTAAERADYYRWMFFAAGPLEAASVNGMLGVEVPAERMAMVGYGSLARIADSLAQALGDHDYIAGDRFTAADVYVSSQIAWLSGVGVLPMREAFGPYLERTVGRPAAVRARGIDDALIAQGIS